MLRPTQREPALLWRSANVVAWSFGQPSFARPDAGAAATPHRTWTGWKTRESR